MVDSEPDQAGPSFITPEHVTKTPKSNWYRYALHCGHTVYTRIRISFRGAFQQHFVKCPKCENKAPTAWSPMENMEAVTDEHVSNVHDGSSFILSRRILRTDGPGTTTGNPFPYSHADRDY